MNEPTRTLTQGVEIPLVGFGTFQIPNEATADTVAEALSEGYRHIDAAEVYGNEAEVGEGLRRGMSDNGLRREDVFVTTKLWPGGSGGASRGIKQSLEALAASLGRLGLDYVDLYLIHRPVDRAQRIAQWKALVRAHEEGLARAIGVSNFNVGHIEDLLGEGLPVPHADQVELHLWSQKPELVGYLERKGVVPIAYSSLAPLSTWRAGAGQSSGKTAAMQADSEASPFAAMAEKYGVSEAQFLLRWAVQQGFPVLPRSTKPARMRQNRDLFGFTIDADDMAAIATMDRGRGIAWGAADPTLSD